MLGRSKHFDNTPKIKTAFIAVTIVENPRDRHNDNEFLNKAWGKTTKPENGRIEKTAVISKPSFDLVA